MKLSRLSRATTSTLLGPLTLASAFALTACGPIAFEDGTALTVIGDPPAPPPKPVVVAEKPKRVVVEDNRIVINEKIQFDFDKATIKPESDSLLQEIITVIKENEHIKKIGIEGHTSSEGSDSHNLKLSDKRAKAVVDYLVTKGGLPKAMFAAKGFGESKLIGDESTEDGKEKNRRVEFNILEQNVTKKRVVVDPESGEKTVMDDKTKSIGGSDAAAGAKKTK